MNQKNDEMMERFSVVLYEFDKTTGKTYPYTCREFLSYIEAIAWVCEYGSVYCRGLNEKLERWFRVEHRFILKQPL